MAVQLIPIIILGLGARLVAPHIANQLIKTGMAKAATESIKKGAKNVYQSLESLPKWVAEQLKSRNVQAAVDKTAKPLTKNQKAGATNRATNQRKWAEVRRKEAARKLAAQKKKEAEEAAKLRESWTEKTGTGPKLTAAQKKVRRQKRKEEREKLQTHEQVTEPVTSAKTANKRSRFGRRGESTQRKKGGKVFNKGGKVFNGNDFVRSFYEGGSV